MVHFNGGLKWCTTRLAPLKGAFNGALTTDVRQIDESSDVTSLGRLTVSLMPADCL